MTDLRLSQLTQSLPVTPKAATATQAGRGPNEAGEFARHLKKALQDVRWSAHAEARLRESHMTLSDAARTRLARAVDRLAAKGGQQGLVLMGQTAFLVSVPNRTVVTAVAGERLREGVFTQIDSAVILTEE